jgi:hypothetical protein
MSNKTLRKNMAGRMRHEEQSLNSRRRIILSANAGKGGDLVVFVIY